MTDPVKRGSSASMPFAPPSRIWKQVGFPFSDGRLTHRASITDREMVPTPSLNTREPSGDLTSGISVTRTLLSSSDNAKGVSEKAWPILAAHLAGDVMWEKSPSALMMEKYV